MKNTKLSVKVTATVYTEDVVNVLMEAFLYGFRRMNFPVKQQTLLETLANADVDDLTMYDNDAGIKAWVDDVLSTAPAFDSTADLADLGVYKRKAVVKWFGTYGMPWVKAQVARIQKAAAEQPERERLEHAERLQTMAKTLISSGWLVTPPVGVSLEPVSPEVPLKTKPKKKGASK